MECCIECGHRGPVSSFQVCNTCATQLLLQEGFSECPRCRHTFPGQGAMCTGCEEELRIPAFNNVPPILTSNRQIDTFDVRATLQKHLNEISAVNEEESNNQQRRTILIISGMDGPADGSFGPGDSDFYRGDVATREWFEDHSVYGAQMREKNIAIRVIDLRNYLFWNHHTQCRDFMDRAFEEEIARQGEVVAVIMAFCHSHRSIMNTVLAGVGQSAQIMIRWDHALITGGRAVTLSQQQLDIIRRVADTSPGLVLLSGSHGTGKTLEAFHAAIILGARYTRRGNPWTLTICLPGNATQLKECMKQMVDLVNIDVEVNVTTVNDLCAQLKIKAFSDVHSPWQVNMIMAALQSNNPNKQNILFMDEVYPTSHYPTSRTDPLDWTSLTIPRLGNHLLLCFKAHGMARSNPYVRYERQSNFMITPPSGAGVVAEQLTCVYRNSEPVQTLQRYLHRHGGAPPLTLHTPNISVVDNTPVDESQKPKGKEAAWLFGGSTIDKLEEVERKEKGRSVTVVFGRSVSEWKPGPRQEKKTRKEVMDFCQERNSWKVVTAGDCKGWEDEVVVLLGIARNIELWDRARTTVYILDNGMPLDQEYLTFMAAHSSPTYQCEVPDCEFVGRRVLRKLTRLRGEGYKEIEWAHLESAAQEIVRRKRLKHLCDMYMLRRFGKRCIRAPPRRGRY